MAERVALVTGVTGQDGDKRSPTRGASSEAAAAVRTVRLQI